MSTITTLSRKPLIVWDVIVSVILLLIGAAVSVVITLASLFLAMAGDSCGVVECNYDQIGTGWIITMAAPTALWLATAAVAIVRMVKRRIAWWFVLIGIVVLLAVWGLGVWLVFSAVG